MNVNLVKKQKHLFQIAVRELHNYMILPIPQQDFFGVNTVDHNVCIGETYLRKYTPKNIYNQ